MTRFAGSKAKAMDPEIARNQNYDDHYANDSEDVHSALLPFHDDSAQRARTVSFRHRWLGSMEARKYKSLLSPPPISPISAPSEEQKEHDDNQNEIHIFLQNVWGDFPYAHMGCRITIHQPRNLPITILTGTAMKPASTGGEGGAPALHPAGLHRKLSLAVRRPPTFGQIYDNVLYRSNSRIQTHRTTLPGCQQVNVGTCLAAKGTRTSACLRTTAANLYMNVLDR